MQTVVRLNYILQSISHKSLTHLYETWLYQVVGEQVSFAIFREVIIDS